MAKTKKELGLCQLTGCKEKVSGHHAHCEKHRARKFLAGPSPKTFAARQVERQAEKDRQKREGSPAPR